MASPSEVFAAQMAELRKVRGWTTQELSDRLRRLGVDLHPTAITKIEKRGRHEEGSRGISLDEAVALAVAFNVPPVMLWLPLDVEKFDITPAQTVNPWDVMGWVLDERPLVFSDIAGWRDWTEAAYELHKRQQKVRKAVAAAVNDQRRAEFQNDEQRKSTAQERYVEALEAVADTWRATERHGFVPPGLPSAWVDDMAELGMDPSPDWRAADGED